MATIKINGKPTANGRLWFTAGEERDFLTLIKHVKEDMHYGWQGSFGGGDEDRADGGMQTKDIKETERAIALLKRLIIQGN